MHLLLLLACTKATPLVFLDEYLLPGDDAFPESVAWDPQTAAFYTSSLGRGDVTQTLVTGESSTFYVNNGEIPWVTVGLEVDAERRRLWVCASVFDGSAPGELWVLDLDSGALLSTLSLGSARADASCTDVNLDPEGVAYVTDRENPDIYRVNADTQSVELWIEDPLLEPGFVGLNGVVFSPDGQSLLVTQYLPTALIRLPLDNPAGLAAVTLNGEPFEGDSSLNGADDVVVMGELLYATLVDRLFTLRSEDGWISAEISGVDLPDDGVTGLAVAEGALFGANGQAVQYALDQEPETPFWIHRVNLP